MIIGICGLIGSGKGTVADTLVTTYGFQKLSFADKLKDAVSEMFEWPRQMLEGKTPQSRDWRERPDAFWSSEMGKDITPRHVLQVFGTECMRHGFFDGVWVSLVKKKIQENPNTNWVLPDTRFPNEVNMIKNLLERLSDNKAITTTDINLINKVMSGSLAFRLQSISTSDRYLKAMTLKKLNRNNHEKGTKRNRGCNSLV